MKAILVGDRPVLAADSAILRTGEPLFIDGEISDWRSVVAPGVKISRLGTNIHIDFANAYFDSVAMFHLLMPANPDMLPGDLWGMSDRSISPGIFVELPLKGYADLQAGRNAATTRCQAPALHKQRLGVPITDHACRAIADLSRSVTFKTGDILIFPDFAIDLESPVIDTIIEASINNIQSLHLKIK